MKVLANDGISASGIAAIEASGHELITTKVAQEQLENYINEHHIDVVLVRSATTVQKRFNRRLSVDKRYRSRRRRYG